MGRTGEEGDQVARPLRTAKSLVTALNARRHHIVRAGDDFTPKTKRDETSSCPVHAI